MVRSDRNTINGETVKEIQIPAATIEALLEYEKLEQKFEKEKKKAISTINELLEQYTPTYY